ncbi:PEGA domain-containing protein, partial [Myxococcota bacterium]|nr:PEGA domain-containing protein [Myxococcota bacterium]
PVKAASRAKPDVTRAKPAVATTEARVIAKPATVERRAAGAPRSAKPARTKAAAAEVKEADLSGSTGASATEPAFLEIRSAEPGVAIEIFDVKVGKTPLPKLELDPGAYTVWAQKPGYEIFTADVKLTPGQTTSLDVKLVKIPKLDPNEPDDPLPPR